MKAQNQILAELRKEINQTLIFFVQTDLEIYGFITSETVSCFKNQKVKFPKILKDLVK